MGEHKSDIWKSSDMNLSHLSIREVIVRHKSRQSFSITRSPSSPTAPALSEAFQGPQTRSRTGLADQALCPEEPASETGDRRPAALTETRAQAVLRGQAASKRQD